MCIKSKTALAAAFFLFVFHCAALPLFAEFLASKTSNKYHKPNCKWAKRIKPTRLIKFETVEDAVEAGYIPCRYCKPPYPEKIEDEKVGRDKEDDYNKWFYKGYALSNAGDNAGAIKAFTKSIEINPLDAKSYYNRGLAYAKTGSKHQAISDFNKTIELNPRYSTAYTNRGVIYLGMKDYDRAAEDFNTAIEIDSGQHWAYYNKACLFSLTNQIGESCIWLEKAIKKGYNNWNHIDTDLDLNNIRNEECYKKLLTLKELQ